MTRPWSLNAAELNTKLAFRASLNQGIGSQWGFLRPIYGKDTAKPLRFDS